MDHVSPITPKYIQEKTRSIAINKFGPHDLNKTESGTKGTGLPHPKPTPLHFPGEQTFPLFQKMATHLSLRAPSFVLTIYASQLPLSFHWRNSCLLLQDQSHSLHRDRPLCKNSKLKLKTAPFFLLL